MIDVCEPAGGPRDDELTAQTGQPTSRSSVCTPERVERPHRSVREAACPAKSAVESPVFVTRSANPAFVSSPKHVRPAEPPGFMKTGALPECRLALHASAPGFHWSSSSERNAQNTATTAGSSYGIPDWSDVLRCSSHHGPPGTRRQASPTFPRTESEWLALSHGTA